MDKEKWLLLWGYHAESASFKKKVRKTREVIDEFLSIKGNSKVYCAWSTGKDSTALLHLILQVNQHIRVMSQNDDIDTDEIRSYRDKIVDSFSIKVDEVSTEYKILDFIKDYGIDITEDICSHGTTMSDTLFYKPIENYRKENNFTGYFFGLRRHESKAREKNFLSRGHIYRKKNKAFVCQPLAEWTARDVFAYLVSNNIPINPIYFFTKFKKSPEYIRSNYLLPGSFSNKGEAAWIKHYFPEIFNKLIEVCPKILAYV